MADWTVRLPPGVREPYGVFINGVRQEPGRDFEVRGLVLVFDRPLTKEGRLGFWRWFLGAWGIGTYRKNDQVDITWEVDGQPARGPRARHRAAAGLTRCDSFARLIHHPRGGMMRGRGAFAAAMRCAAAHSGDRERGGTAAGGRDLGQPRVRRTVSPGAAGITEGKFDEVRGKKVLVITGRFGFKTYDVSEPEEPGAARRVPARGHRPVGSATSPLGGYWQNEDMELDTKRKLIIGALDPRHNDAGPTATARARTTTARRSATRTARAASSSSRTRIRATCGRSATSSSLPSGHTSSCIQDCKYIWTGGPARRADQDWLGDDDLAGSRPDHAAEPPDRATAGRSGSPTCATRRIRRCPTCRSTCAATTATRDYSHDVDEDERGIAWVAGRGGIRGYATRAGIATRTRTGCARRRRSTRSSWPAAASSGTSRPPAGRRRRRAGDRLHAQLRPADRRLRSGRRA